MSLDLIYILKKDINLMEKKVYIVGLLFENIVNQTKVIITGMIIGAVWIDSIVSIPELEFERVS